MFIADVASLEWEVLRWRRLKFHLIRSRAHQPLTKFLGEYLNYDLYREGFTEDLSEILENAAPKDQAKGVARIVAHGCARNQADALDKVSGILARFDMTIDYLLKKAQKQKAEELAQAYMRGERRAIALVHKHLADVGVSIDVLVAEGMQNPILEYIERIDRLITIAESCRNSSLREIERRRAALGETLRRSVQGIEDGKFKVIETASVKGRNVA